MAMASQISASCTCLCSSLAASTKSHLLTFPSLKSYHKASKFDQSLWISHLGSSHFSPYIGLKHLGISISRRSSKTEKKRRCKGMVVRASLFGVGAPEALVIGVVALLVFGPKGLAEVARNLGKTLRAFQPTIRELQDVSREFKSTLEREIGLDDISAPNMYNSNRMNYGPPTPSVPSTEDPPVVKDPNGETLPKAYTTEDYLKITEEQLKASAVQQPEQPSSPGQIRPEDQIQGQESAALQTPPSGDNIQPPSQAQPKGTEKETVEESLPTQDSKRPN
ncbi:PREDICTED: sec-independent protein translocase protein TATB, chloroplastic [Tarenaya hassleriana]|uniref:sec-independent protein translocase protein TATB, chloroplastic n=1 Tax=Tarenaya hassleriana TaxID=28532 RepID=UPI00053C30E5|nr:PREDICTED: sec-independent protein translocase protein TATB, chloroplastic [Tarenaya hassleriana]